ncbi:hypothetical protein AB6D56_06500 [Vibrio lentus]
MRVGIEKVVKETKYLSHSEKFEPSLFLKNSAVNIRTQIIFDTNILNYIHKAVQKGNKAKCYKDMGLSKLIKGMKKPGISGVILNPYLSLQEVPEAMVEPLLKSFEAFALKHLSAANWDSNQHPVVNSDDYSLRGYFDIDETIRRAMSVSYLSLLILHYVSRLESLTPTEKYEKYLDLVIEYVDVISIKESFIAQLIFAEIKKGQEQVREIKSSVNRNFMKNSQNKVCKSTEQICASALNGAYDLFNANLAMSQLGSLESTRKTESWIVSNDHKLLRLLTLTPAISNNGDRTNYTGVKELEGTADDPYWRETNAYVNKATMARRKVTQPDYDFIELNIQKICQLLKMVV